VGASPYAADVKPPAPEIVRKGAVVRIDAAEHDASAAAGAYAIAFVDLRFDDGHVERWLGSGSLRDDPSDPVLYSELMGWATSVATEHTLIADLGMNFSNVDRRALETAPVEIVFEWNADLPRFD
jgi:hypothetical protein